MRPFIALLLTLTLGSVTLDELMGRDGEKNLVTDKKEELYLSLNIENGSKLQLSDGSTYLISPEDRIYTVYWITPFPIRLGKSSDDEFPVKITNITTNTSVKGKEISTKDLIQKEAKKYKYQPPPTDNQQTEKMPKTPEQKKQPDQPKREMAPDNAPAPKKPEPVQEPKSLQDLEKEVKKPPNLEPPGQ